MGRKLIHIGLGPMGLRVLGSYIQREMGRLVAAVDLNPEFADRPLTEFLKGAPPQIRVHNSLKKALDQTEATCALVTTQSRLEDCEPTFESLLRRGLAVVSTCEELLYPYTRQAERARALHTLAVSHGGRLLGTGVNPGFLMDTLPALLTTICEQVDGIEIDRVQNAVSRRLPFQHKIGVGLSRSEFRSHLSLGTLGHMGLTESVHFLAATLGFELTSLRQEVEPVLADTELVVDSRRIQAGHVAGIDQIATGMIHNTEVIRLHFRASIAEPESFDRIAIRGQQAVNLRIVGGVHGDTATTAVILNALPQLENARPGLHTMMTIPAPHWSHDAAATLS